MQKLGSVFPEVLEQIGDRAQMDPADFRPIEVPAMPVELASASPKTIQGLLSKSRAGNTLDSSHEMPLARAYGDWLGQVTWHEAQNAGRLQGLLCRIIELRDQDTGRWQRAVEFTAKFYGLDVGELIEPFTVTWARRTAQTVTRNWVAMSREWRPCAHCGQLGHVEGFHRDTGVIDARRATTPEEERF